MQEENLQDLGQLVEHFENALEGAYTEEDSFQTYQGEPQEVGVYSQQVNATEVCEADLSFQMQGVSIEGGIDEGCIGVEQGGDEAHGVQYGEDGEAVASEVQTVGYGFGVQDEYYSEVGGAEAEVEVTEGDEYGNGEVEGGEE